MVSALLARGARTDTAAHDGSTPLHFAAHGQGRAEAAAALLRHGAPAPHTTIRPLALWPLP